MCVCVWHTSTINVCVCVCVSDCVCVCGLLLITRIVENRLQSGEPSSQTISMQMANRFRRITDPMAGYEPPANRRTA